MQIQIVIASALPLLVLLLDTLLSIYKPRGKTRYGLRKQRDQQKMPSWDS